MKTEEKLLKIYGQSIRDLQTIRKLLDAGNEGTAAAQGYIALQNIVAIIEEKEG